jgi:hypothetical protein
MRGGFGVPHGFSALAMGTAAGTAGCAATEPVDVATARGRAGTPKLIFEMCAKKNGNPVVADFRFGRLCGLIISAAPFCG